MPDTHTPLTAPTRAPLFRSVHPLGAARPDMLAALRAGVLAEVYEAPERDLSMRQLAVLLVLQQGAAHFDVVATQVGISKPALTRALNRLELSFMVERYADRQDRRRIYVEITTTGLDRLRAISDAMEGVS